MKYKYLVFTCVLIGLLAFTGGCGSNDDESSKGKASPQNAIVSPENFDTNPGSDIKPTGDIIEGRGRVIFLSFEGGFWGIIDDNNKAHYDPVNLDPKFQIKDLPVVFSLRLLKDQVSFHMWGARVEVIKIEKIPISDP